LVVKGIRAREKARQKIITKQIFLFMGRPPWK